MSRLRIDIERLVLDAAALDPAKAGRLAALTQAAVERLLRGRGTAYGQLGSAPSQHDATVQKPGSRTAQPEANSDHRAEERWADELARTICRAIDRSL